ncbi:MULTISPECIES: DNA helicase RecQ [Roseivirga]|jgi:ATP-dependent DNA helicase RecQ|uniref:DNA helicase RecQ n=1 Tax=Roseivirga spongicola TaxID=333140 RepID=A0A150XI27_9BACT|nr:MULTISPECIES: DNA helicase RecQ [Roseivirga]KYG78356.1 ATP-dependent DNA helicase RecQ [Roseivirga spongicola]MBO6496711.1 DNA helicase RecQ [Roseivirga sp.]MBO6660817.1 DNA helicase RecQ [Roseivirga sp.]MBO6759972.1 DNA helicase RecQ [Roseivirga sp.]MBO6909199.1 DNA helicase RecQ [Roseivirga sp.]
MVSVEVLRSKLKEVFGYDQFRGNQEKIILNLLARKNTFVIMPTGAGKSMCYQMPAIVQEGTAIVISPLIALMKNQVDQMNAVGVNARFLNSTLSKSEINRIKKATLAGELKLLYIAPESLTKEENVDFLRQANISFAAIDEAHCISEWGHDFRPEYRRIKSIINHLGDIPIIALTATATPKVQLDIQRNLQMEDADLFKSSFNRENLYYEVRPKKGIKKQLIKFIRENQGKSGVIYCLSRKKVEEIAQFLQVNGFKAAPYHAGFDPAVRMKNQDDFLNEEVDVIVATIAFGMGIDKPDVRFVIHYDVPKSLEGYYQETGRAGRDGLEGQCVMFYSYNDILKLEKFNKDKPVTEKENAKILLEEMSSYAESAVCRRKQLLHYFGEEYDDTACKKSGMCDNCRYEREKYDGQEYVKTVVQAVEQTGQRFGIGHLVSVIRGSSNQYVKSYGHDKLPVYGVGKSEDESLWKSIVRQTLLNEFVEKDIENIGTLKLSKKGLNFLEKPYYVEFTKDLDYSDVDQTEEESNETPASPNAGNSFDKVLFDLLKAERKKIAKEKDLPPYVIIQDPSLQEMATTYPTTDEALANVNGIGMGKVQKFGQSFLKIIKQYVKDNEIDIEDVVVIKSSGNKSKNKIYIIQQVDRKIDLEEVAEQKGWSMSTLIDEMEIICFAGTRLNLDYYLESFIDEDLQADIIDYFLDAESDSIADALDEFDGEDITEDDMRLMRIKFLSEHAN